MPLPQGVSWNSACGKWVAVLWDRNLKRARHLGSFESEEDAARAYDKEALKLLGAEAGLNFRESACRSFPCASYFAVSYTCKDCASLCFSIAFC